MFFWLEKIKIILLFTLVIGLNLSALVFDYEDWPFTNAPMFAHYVSEETPRYKFSFIAEDLNGETKEVYYPNAHLRWMAMRHFFKYIYGSVEDNSSFNIYPEDNLYQFEERLSDYFQVFYQRLAPNEYQQIRLKIDLLAWQDNKTRKSIEVGVFDIKTGQFIHTFSNV